jgi:hypothetical protein
MAEPAHDFFEDLEQRLKAGGDVHEVLNDIRRDWRGAQVYISPYSEYSRYVHYIRAAWSRHKLEFCRQFGVSASSLDKMLSGRPPSRHELDNQLSMLE